MEFDHRHVETNGVRIHIVTAGRGPAVVLCHGFPETWYSWRHQIEEIARAGFQVIVPDQRGFGSSDCPESVEAYDMFQLVGDIVGLLSALDLPRAAIVGNDWGSVVASRCALLRPDLFGAVGLFSVPYLPRSWGNHPPMEAMRRTSGDKVFYQVYFQQPGKADAELGADIEKSLTMLLYSLSGSAAPGERWRPFLEASESILDTGFLPEALPGWLTEEDLRTYVEDFERTGFGPGLNWYRNIDRNWRLSPFLSGAPIQQPALFVAGEHDPVPAMFSQYESAMSASMPNLRAARVLKRVGHWAPQEDPETVNRILVEFLKNNAT